MQTNRAAESFAERAQSSCPLPHGAVDTKPLRISLAGQGARRAGGRASCQGRGSASAGAIRGHCSGDLLRGTYPKKTRNGVLALSAGFDSIRVRWVVAQCGTPAGRQMRQQLHLRSRMQSAEHIVDAECAALRNLPAVCRRTLAHAACMRAEALVTPAGWRVTFAGRGAAASATVLSAKRWAVSAAGIPRMRQLAPCGLTSLQEVCSSRQQPCAKRIGEEKSSWRSGPVLPPSGMRSMRGWPGRTACWLARRQISRAASAPNLRPSSTPTSTRWHRVALPTSRQVSRRFRPAAAATILLGWTTFAIQPQFKSTSRTWRATHAPTLSARSTACHQADRTAAAAF